LLHRMSPEVAHTDECPASAYVGSQGRTGSV
jgi:hypothetical protein